MKHIIIAETVQQTVDKANSLFSRGTVTLIPAASCEDILELHRKQKVDLIIADANLPRMGGARLCTAVRSDPALKDVSIIMVCENGDPAADEYRKAGSNDVLPRPVDPVRLFSTVSRMIMVQNRMAVRIPLRISVEGRDQKEAFVGISQDMSVSGMLLDSARVMQSGQRFACSFTLSSRVVTVECMVVRVLPTPGGGYQCGVKFVNLDAKTFVLIEHFAKSNPSTK